MKFLPILLSLFLPLLSVACSSGSSVAEPRAPGSSTAVLLDDGTVAPVARLRLDKVP